ncbi:MAG: response regulator transcription factor [Chloroflexaceae bacterium]|nr:response regulator transcription factor [Chloroflexaceae bacterium]
MRILLVDDEAELTDPLSQLLAREGYQIDVAGDGPAGIALALQSPYDLLILDWMLPHLGGVQLCQQLRARGQGMPVLFLTAKDTVDDRVAGLDAGADDYLVKPFELRELLARVRALLRRSGLEGGAIASRLRVADLELDSDNQVAYRQGRTIDLSDKEARLLGYFMRHPGQLLTHQEIQTQLWPEEEKPSSNVLAALVRLLRRKIEAPGEASLIHTVYGKGYRFGD